MPLPQPPPDEREERAPANQNAVAVISAYGAFRLLLILLAIWTSVEGFALLTGGPSALSLGGTDRTAERIVGAQMIVFVPVYGLLAWNRDRYRLLIWVPYGAQLAIIVPALWALLVNQDADGILLLIVSLIFFVLLFYFWWHSHPLDFFAGTPDDGDLDDDEDGAFDDDAGDDADRGESSRPVRARDVARRPGRFRRRDG